MRRHTRRTLVWLAMMLTGATVFQTSAFTGTTGAGNHGCGRFMSNGLLSSVDFCYLLDCENGFFGGVVDPCSDPSSGALLLDCPGAGGGVAVDGGVVANGGTADGTTTNGGDTTGGVTDTQIPIPF